MPALIIILLVTVNLNGSLKSKFLTPVPDHLIHLDYHINSILVSHKKDPRVISKKTQVVVHNVLKILNKGWSVRGMLHNETLFGKKNSTWDEFWTPCKKITTVI